MFEAQCYYPTHTHLLHSVEYFQVVESAPMKTARSIPNTRMDGWIVLEGSFDICYDGSGVYLPAPVAGICPLRDKPLFFRTLEGFRVINFKCFPHVLSIPTLAPLQSSLVALDFGSFFPKKEVDNLLDIMQMSISDELKIKELEFFLARGMLNIESSESWLHLVMHRIWESEVAEIEDLAASAFVSVKTLERRFQQQTGLKPKSFCKLARLQRVLKAIQQDTKGQFVLPHVWQAGYYDQSHFIKDCRAITGLSPGRLFAQLPKLSTDLILLNDQI